MYPPSLHQNMAHNSVMGIGVSGQALMSNSNASIYPSISTNISESEFHVRGNAVIKGTLTVGGQEITKTIDERLSAIEERLGILRVDEALADRWAELGELRKRYRELEQECWEKEEIIRLLKGKNT